MHKAVHQIKKQPRHDQNPDAKLESAKHPLGTSEVELESILRWEEEGGRIVERDELSFVLVVPRLKFVDEE